MKQLQSAPQIAQTPARPQLETAPVLDALEALEAPGQMPQGMGNDFLVQEALLQQAFEGPGASLPYRDGLESVYGRDLGDVRVTDGAEQLDDIGVAAVARDGAIALGSGADFDTVAHEVAHIAQFEAHGAGTGIGATSGAAEREADHAMAAARDGETPLVEARPDGAMHCRLFDRAAFLQGTVNDSFDFATGAALVELEEADLAWWTTAGQWVEWFLAMVEETNVAWDGLSELMRNGALEDAKERADDVLARVRGVFTAGDDIAWIGEPVAAALEALREEDEDLDSDYNQLRLAVDFEVLQTWVDWHGQTGRYPEPGGDTFLEQAWAQGQEEAPLDLYKDVYSASTPLDIGDLDAEQELKALVASREGGQGLALDDTSDAWHYLWPKGMSRPQDDIGCRIYCNVHPSVAAAFAGQVADILGQGGEVVMGGKASALKVVVGEDVGKRCDSVVIYVRQYEGDAQGALSERERILGEIARICASDMDADSAERLPAVPGATGTWADAMLEELPGMTRRVARGGATAEHPQDGRSFGQRICASVQGALQEALDLGLAEEQFVSLALVRMAEAGIDPSAPWRVGPEAPRALRARVDRVEDVFDPRRGRVLYRRALGELEAGHRGGVEIDPASLQELIAEMMAA